MTDYQFNFREAECCATCKRRHYNGRGDECTKGASTYSIESYNICDMYKPYKANFNKPITG